MVSTFLGTSGLGTESDGSGWTVHLNYPEGLCIDPTNHKYLYVLDRTVNQIHKIEIETATTSRIGASKINLLFSHIRIIL